MSKFTEGEISAYCLSRGWVRTSVFASPNDIQRCGVWAEEYRSTPLIRVHGRWLNEDAEDLFRLRVHELARSYGLPELQPTPDGPDRYGIIVTGEFVRLQPAIKRRNNSD